MRRLKKIKIYDLQGRRYFYTDRSELIELMKKKHIVVYGPEGFSIQDPQEVLQLLEGEEKENK